MAPSGGGGTTGLQAEVISILLFLLLLAFQTTQALEVMEQCRVENRRTGEKAMANIKGTLVYTKQMQTLKADFWKEGVGGSKRILKKILKKITNYEEQHVNLDEEVNKKLGRRFRRLGKEDVWYDQAQHRPVYKDEFCAAVDDLKTRERTSNEGIKEINYDCPETEQLYGIGYHKVYEQCKDDPFLAKFDVDFSVCLHAHYPWVDMLNWGVCVMKQYNSNFLACFCSTKGGLLDKRSYCITKFECFLHGQGLTKPRQMLVVKDSCMAAIEYFTEPGIMEDEWLSEKQQAKLSSWDNSGVAWVVIKHNPASQWLDKLRVRAPYHMESPCFEQSFSSAFDVGQFKQDLASTSVKIPPTLQVEVFTPKLDGYRVIEMDDQIGRKNGKAGGTCRIPETKPEPRVEQPQCGAKPPPEEPVNPQVQKKKLDLIEIYTERMVTTSVPWIPGIFFLYSYLLSERSRKQKLFVNGVQFAVIILGTYNSIVSTVLWKSSLYTLSGMGRNEVIALVAAFSFACCINYKEIGELYLILSLLHFASNILLLFLIPHIRTEENVMTCTFISYLISVTLTVMLIFLVWRQVDKLDKKKEKETRWKQEMVDMIASGQGRGKEGDRRKPGKVKSGQQKRLHPMVQREEPKDFSQVYNEIEEEVRERSRIQCGWKSCKESSNMGYISLSCSQVPQPHAMYHSACWKLLLFSLEVREERGLLGTTCLIDICLGKVSRLCWFTGLGREITSRRLVWDPPKQTRKSSQAKKGEALSVQRRPESRKVLSVAPRIREPEPKAQEDLLDCEKPKSQAEKTVQPYEETDVSNQPDSDEDVELQRVASYSQISNTFGTIGSERKAKNSVTAAESPSSLSSTSSPIPQTEFSSTLLGNFLLGEDDWGLEIPQPPPALGPRSKILSMIENNREPIPKKVLADRADRSGFLMTMDFHGRSGSSLSYIPDSKRVGEDNEPPENPLDLAVNYISSQESAFPFEEQSWLLDGYDPDLELYKQLEESDPKESKEAAITLDEFDCPPLTRILRKSLSEYGTAQIDIAMAVVMESIDCQSITIPEFQGLVKCQLEKRSSILSDLDECHMCLEPLYGGPEVEALNPCNHVFHVPCIRPWLHKDPTCPKCRAKIVG